MPWTFVGLTFTLIMRLPKTPLLLYVVCFVTQRSLSTPDGHRAVISRDSINAHRELCNGEFYAYFERLSLRGVLYLQVRTKLISSIFSLLRSPIYFLHSE